VPRKAKIRPITKVDDPRYVKALGHPLRVRILALLDEGAASPVQLAERLGATLGTVAYHTRTLEQLGLIEMVATHQRRGATEHVYAARERPGISDEAWAAASPVAKHVLISSTLTNIGDFAAQSAAGGGFDRRDANASRLMLKLDEKGWAALARASQKWLDEAVKIEGQARERLERTGEPSFEVGLAILLFEALAFSGPHASPGTRGRQRTPKATR
jgi:DNA-binding transcriptional ArsR family regulator